jgi:hypothetical protein
MKLVCQERVELLVKEDIERDGLKAGETQCVWVASNEHSSPSVIGGKAIEWLKNPAPT